MAEIIDSGESWKLVINTTATKLDPRDGYIDEFRTKGYRAEVGRDDNTGQHVVMWVEYDKKRNTLDDVAKKVDQLRTCGRCQTLDKKNLNLGKIQLGGGVGSGEGTSASQNSNFPGMRGADIPQARAAAPVFAAEMRKPSAVKDMFSNLIFDAYFTRAGKYYLGLMTGDETLIDSALPKDQNEMGVFMNEILDFMTGDVEFVRSPEEAKEFLGALRAPASEESRGGVAAHKKKKSINTGTVIY
ncbi:MAG: hypothetical protein PHH85_02080 [Candidatus Methanoperedens sp.]|nr:hypothetical protein [Candidatus Methanoperedens sp.]